MGIEVFGRALFVAIIAALVGCGGSNAEPASSSAGQLQAFLVSTSANAGGSLSPSSVTVEQNAHTSFTITPDTGFSLASATGCGGSLIGSTYTTAPITASCTVVADFSLNSYNVSTAATTGGSVSPQSSTVSYGDTASFTLAADPGYGIDSVSGCAGTLVGDVYTTGSVASDCAVSVTFVPLLFAIGGNITGLDGVLQLSYQNAVGVELIDITANGSFTVTSQAQLGHDYNVSVHAQPVGQSCSVVNGVGVVAGDVTDISVSCETSVPPAQVTGTVSASAAIAVDSDINDVFAPFVDNSTPTAAQSLYHQATVHGFASAEPTAGSVDTERFAAAADMDDYFRVVLEAGQTVQLQVVDHNGLAKGSRFDGDLDLYLFDANYNLVGISESATEFEEITVAVSQEYLINVHAHSGVSKYVMRLFPALATTSTSATPVPEFVPNEMIVKYRETSTGTATMTSAKPGVPQDMGLTEATKRSAKVGIDVAQRIPGAAMEQMQQLNPLTYDRVMTLRSIKEMRGRDDVVYAEPNYVRRGLLVPNDPHYGLQWHYSAIGLPQAWETTTGTGATQDVVVAVVDTGVVLAHPDMSGQLTAGYDFISSSTRSRDGDGIDSDPDDPGDSDTLGHSSWHGTHVAGTVAAASNNGVGVAGAAWGAKIMPLRALGKDGGSSYDIIQAVRYAAGLENDSGTLPAQRADIINMSFGGSYGSAAEQEVYAAVRAAGVILVAAAGNNASSTAFYPAAYPEVISVSATDYANKLAPYSNYGATIAVAAPGGNSQADLNSDGYPDGVLSASADDSSGTIKPVYRFYNGTSMAAPHVAGVLALMKAVNGQLLPGDVDTLLQNGAITDDIGVAGRDDYYGYGLINAVKAVQAAADLASGSEPAPAEAKVVADPGQLDLGFRSSASLTLSNQGGGTPVVSSFAASELWIAVTAVAVDASGLGDYSVSIDRNGLATGTYTGDVTFNLDGGTAVVVPVTIQVDSASNAGELARTYVLLINSQTGELVDEVAIGGDVASASYAFEQVPAGEYRIVAGSDVDADNYICTQGESCGKYASVDSPQTVIVNGADVIGIDFTVDVLTGLADTLVEGYLLMGK